MEVKHSKQGEIFSFGELVQIPSQLCLIYISIELFHPRFVAFVMQGRNKFFMPFGLVMISVRYGVLVSRLYLLIFQGQLV